MVRPIRIEYAGAIYHITSRGIDRRDIFKDDKDREHLIKLLKEGSDFYKVEVIAYCLMSNHFHFLLCTKKANLSRFMQRLNVAYTRYFNYKYKRVGPLMQGRYKAILVESEEYFKLLSRYIYLNPVKIKAAEKEKKIDQKLFLSRYKWSSYDQVLNPEKRSKYFKCEQVLDNFGGDNKAGRKKYEKYVMEGLSNTVENPMDGLRYQFLLGSDKFVEGIKRTFIKEKDLKPFSSEIRGMKQPSIEKIAKTVAKEYGINLEKILVSHSKHKEARKVLIELCYKFCLAAKTLKQIGSELGGISGAGVFRVHERLQEKIKDDKILSERIKKLTDIICQ